MPNPIFQLLYIMPVFAVLLGVGNGTVETVKVGAGETDRLDFSVATWSVAFGVGFHDSYIYWKELIPCISIFLNAVVLQTALLVQPFLSFLVPMLHSR